MTEEQRTVMQTLSTDQAAAVQAAEDKAAAIAREESQQIARAKGRKLADEDAEEQEPADPDPFQLKRKISNGKKSDVMNAD